LESAMECVTTHQPKRVVRKIDGAPADVLNISVTVAVGLM